MTSHINDPLLISIAGATGTPTYVYFEDVIRNQVSSIRKLFGDLPSEMLYAMKANSHPEVLEIIRSEGVGIDAVSPTELLLALKVGFDRDRILYSANNMTEDEMDLAHESGVMINFGELSRLRKYANKYPGNRVTVRVNPGRGSGHHEFAVTAGEKSKFGISLNDLDEIAELASDGKIIVAGLHQHIGSGNLDTAVIAESMKSLLGVARSFKGLEFVNFGGGFGVPYEKHQTAVDFEQLAGLIQPALTDFLKEQQSGFHFLIEPGRYLVAECGVLLVTVTNLKKVAGNAFAGTDSGMNHLVRPAIYNSYHAVDNLANPVGKSTPYNVVGNICESSDFFANDREVPEISEGDLLAIRDTGAYGMSMASEYNLRSLPCEVMVRSGGEIEVITERRNPEDFSDQILKRVARRSLQVKVS